VSSHGASPSREAPGLILFRLSLFGCFLIGGLGLFSCSGTPAVRETPIATKAPSPDSPSPDRPSGVADEIRRLVELGTPPSLLRALDLIRSRDLGSTDFGRTMVAVDTALLKNVYPEIAFDFGPSDPPQTQMYTRILRDAEKGAYTPSSSTSKDYLELTLPFLALLSEKRSERLATALPDLNRALTLNDQSVLAPYFLGILNERTGFPDRALNFYTSAYGLSADCYPAALGRARLLSSAGKSEEAIQLLTDLVPRYPDNLTIKRELALAYYRAGDWSRAEGALAELLQRNPKDGSLLLMRSHVLIELGQFLQAQPLLDAYVSIEPNNSNNQLYLFLRARLQAEGYKNRDAALTYLRSILRLAPQNEEAAAYSAKLLMESSRPEDQTEGRSLLTKLLQNSNPSTDVLDVALKDAIRRQAWKEALPFLEILLQRRRSASDLQNAYLAQQGLGDPDGALKYARELFDRNTSDENGAFIYISALIGAGKRDEAAKMIDGRLPTLPGGSLKSRYYYLRSLLKTDGDAKMNDLRSSLFEDPRNLDALIAMLDLYHALRDDRRAVYYLKQALALAPDNPKLKAYQLEYASSLNANP